jgi:hypothetical protein
MFRRLKITNDQAASPLRAAGAMNSGPIGWDVPDRRQAPFRF